MGNSILGLIGYEYGERDYPEHAHLENGNYWNICCECGMEFVGYKRTPLCKLCAERSEQDYKKANEIEDGKE